MKKLVLIDGNSLLFRAYFAMRDMVTSDGIHTQGVFAFINMLNRIMQDHKPDSMAVASDMKGGTFRHDMYEDYKAGRMKTPVELLQQVPIMHRVLDAMNITVLELPKYEADDIIGTVSKDAAESGYEVLIITGDKDELQLIDENIKVLITKKGVSEFDLYDMDKMQERYGLTPDQFIDLKGLMGDSSDNIPGVPGIGEKKGIQLLEQYGSIENIISNMDEIPGKLGENFRANIDSARMSKTLATIIRNAPIEYELENLSLTDPDYQKLIEIYKELEFNSFINKLSSAKDIDSKSSGNAFSDETITKILSEVKSVDCLEFYGKLDEGAPVLIRLISDNNHLDTPTCSKLSLYSPDKKLFTEVPLTMLDGEIILREFREKNYSLIGHGLKTICYTLLSYGIDSPKLLFDTEIAEYLIDPNKSKYEIEKMMLRHLNSVWNPEADINSLEYDKYLLVVLNEIHKSQIEMLTKMELSDLFNSCEMKLIEVLASMENEGIKVDRSVLDDIGKQLDELISKLESDIYELAGEKFNINSPKQLGSILFDKLEIKYPSSSKNKSSYSTAADVLEKIKDEHEIVAKVSDYRKHAKLKSTYIDGLIPLIAKDGKIHPHFNQTVAATGRLSCTEPNLQNIPVRDEYGRLIRKAFVTIDEDHSFVGSDYSQIELRILASLSGDANLIKAFNEGEDIHRSTASRVFNIPYDEVSLLDRSRAKAVNFGVVYGMSGFGLSEDLKISRKDAHNYIDDYFEKHPDVKKYLDEQIEIGEEKHEVRTMFGRVRQIPEFTSRKFMERQLAHRLAMNTPIQGTAADIIKIAMIKVYEELSKRKLESRLILQIHDELIIEAKNDELTEVKELLVDMMENAAELKVKMICDLHEADTWYDLK